MKRDNRDTHSGGRSHKWAEEIYDDASTLRVSFPINHSGSDKDSPQRAELLSVCGMFASAKLNGTFEHVAAHEATLPSCADGMEEALLDIHHETLRHSDWEGVPDEQAITEIWRRRLNLTPIWTVSRPGRERSISRSCKWLST